MEKTTRTPYLEEMPITTEATTVHPNNATMIAGPETTGWSRDLGNIMFLERRRPDSFLEFGLRTHSGPFGSFRESLGFSSGLSSSGASDMDSTTTSGRFFSES